MLSVRCDSCGEEIPSRWFEPVFISKKPDGSNGEYYPKWKTRGYSLCENCCEDFLSGKMHADATTEKV